MTFENRITIPRLENAFYLGDFANKVWTKAEGVLIDRYWSGENAPVGRQVRVALLWSSRALYVRFEANQDDPLILSETPNLKVKTVGLWERDVCEIFITRNLNEPEKYYEFEIAPTGEWLDLKILMSSDGSRQTDFDYNSGMQAAAKIEKDKILMTLKIEWKAIGKAPKIGDVWRGNLFRCVGAGETRGYLAWRPTKTAKPNFHVPEAFGEFEFVA